MAVDIIPKPRGFVKAIISPGFAVEFSIGFLYGVPVTTRPYLGSLSFILWPPRIGIPASDATSAPPCSISDNELAAAILPKS